VTHDLLGLFERFTPKFVKQYANLAGEMRSAFTSYKADVRARAFPSVEHTVDMNEEEWHSLQERLATTSPRFVVHDSSVR